MAEVLNSPCRSEPDDEDAQDEVPKDGGFMDTGRKKGAQGREEKFEQEIPPREGLLASR